MISGVDGDQNYYCSLCKGNMLGVEGVLICDCPGCDNEYHMACLDPPITLEELPAGDWICPMCEERTEQRLRSYLESHDKLRSKRLSNCNEDTVVNHYNDWLLELVESNVSMNIWRPNMFQNLISFHWSLILVQAD